MNPGVPSLGGSRFPGLAAGPAMIAIAVAAAGPISGPVPTGPPISGPVRGDGRWAGAAAGAWPGRGPDRRDGVPALPAGRAEQAGSRPGWGEPAPEEPTGQGRRRRAEDEAYGYPPDDDVPRAGAARWR